VHASAAHGVVAIIDVDDQDRCELYVCKARELSHSQCEYSMQCYFMRGGHIEAIEELPGLSDEEAIAKAHAMFSAQKHVYEGFEVWNRSRVLIRHPKPSISNNVAVWPLHRGLPRPGASARKPSLKA
jgi:hypothetical protein